MSYEKKMLSRNKMTAEQLVIRENSTLDFVQNPKTGKLFFTCGSIRGYISPAALELANSDNSNLSDFVYAECYLEGEDPNEAVPVLMSAAATRKNVKRSLGGNLLH